ISLQNRAKSMIVRSNTRRISTINQININEEQLKAKQPYATRAGKSLTQKYHERFSSVTSARALIEDKGGNTKETDNWVLTEQINFEKTPFDDSNSFKCKCPPILIVDDDIFNIMSLEMILKTLSLSCDKAYHGHEALEKLRIRSE